MWKEGRREERGGREQKGERAEEQQAKGRQEGGDRREEGGIRSKEGEGQGEGGEVRNTRICFMYELFTFPELTLSTTGTILILGNGTILD